MEKIGIDRFFAVWILGFRVEIHSSIPFLHFVSVFAGVLRSPSRLPGLRCQGVRFSVQGFGGWSGGVWCGIYLEACGTEVFLPALGARLSSLS